ncbi:MAG: hypothetical protein JJV95_04325 [Sulfurospirillum sp.]|nr:hypothetical protein [Sulfurospirillum sp.]MBL0703188.1 hypothetical protein [Sulfurospirillum sp.]
MQSLQNVFGSALKKSKKDQNLPIIIKESTCELSKKKIQRLKGDSSIQKRLGELFELYITVLKSEELKNSKNIDAVMSGLLKAVSCGKEEQLYKSLYEKDQLEKSILEQKKSIKNTITGVLNTFEHCIEKMDKVTAKESLKALHDIKFRDVEILGVLKETTNEALLTTLEKAEDIEDNVFEITKNMTYETINQGEFSKSRFLNITNTVFEVAIEIANEDQGNAKSLLSGAIHGTKEGMTKAIDKFKNDLKFTSGDMADIVDRDLVTIKKELVSLEDDFIELLENSLKSTNEISREVINDILESELNSSLAKIKRVTQEARDTLGEKIEELKNKKLYLEKDFIKKAEKRFGEFEKVAGQKVEELKNFEFENERAKDAIKKTKHLGNHLLEIIKNISKNTIKNIKNIIKKIK